MILICSLSQPPRKWPVFLGRRDQGPGEPKNRTKVTMSECWNIKVVLIEGQVEREWDKGRQLEGLNYRKIKQIFLSESNWKTSWNDNNLFEIIVLALTAISNLSGFDDSSLQYCTKWPNMKITPYNNLVIDYLKGRALNAFEPFLFFILFYFLFFSLGSWCTNATAIIFLVLIALHLIR